MEFNRPLLKQRRKLSGLTLQELADKIDSSKSYVWELENNRCDPSGKKLCLISRALKTPMEMFYWPHIEIAKEITEDEK